MRLNKKLVLNKRFSWDCANDPETGITYYFSVKGNELLFTTKGGNSK